MKDTNDKELFYDNFASQFDSKMNMYDTNKRVHIIFDKLLGEEDLEGKSLLDAGCGTGWFSKKANERRAVVTSMDIGEKLLKQVKLKCKTTRIVGSVLDIPFEDSTFDYVISSEVIEHTPDPLYAINEFHRVLKPGGLLVVTTPNRFWYFSLVIAQKLKLRPYQGIENWISWKKFVNKHKELNLKIKEERGIHLFPFVHPVFYPILDFFNNYSHSLKRFMVNMAIASRK